MSPAACLRLIEERIASVKNLAVYLCGNSAMIADATSLLQKKGLCPIYREKYYDDTGGWRLMIFVLANAHDQNVLVRRAQWKINQPPSLEGTERAWRSILFLINNKVNTCTVERESRDCDGQQQWHRQGDCAAVRS